MARNFTVAQLSTKARERSDMVDSEFVTPAELRGYISASFTELYDMLIKTGLSYFESEDTIVTDGILSRFPLPADYYGTIGVDRDDGTGHRFMLHEFMVTERNRFQVQSTGFAIGYRVVGNELELLPRPPIGQTYQHLFVPAPADLTDDTDIVDGVSGWEEFIVVDAAIKMLLKEETSAVPLERERVRLIDRIQEASENRALATPRRVVDVHQDHPASGFFRDRFGWP